MNGNKITPGQKIRLARQARRLTTKELGSLVGRSQAWVGFIETGVTPINLDEYEEVQAVLGFRFDTPEAEAAFSFFFSDPVKAANGHS